MPNDTLILSTELTADFWQTLCNNRATLKHLVILSPQQFKREDFSKLFNILLGSPYAEDIIPLESLMLSGQDLGRQVLHALGQLLKKGNLKHLYLGECKTVGNIEHQTLGLTALVTGAYVSTSVQKITLSETMVAAALKLHDVPRSLAHLQESQKVDVINTQAVSELSIAMQNYHLAMSLKESEEGLTQAIEMVGKALFGIEAISRAYPQIMPWQQRINHLDEALRLQQEVKNLRCTTQQLTAPEFSRNRPRPPSREADDALPILVSRKEGGLLYSHLFAGRCSRGILSSASMPNLQQQRALSPSPVPQ